MKSGQLRGTPKQRTPGAQYLALEPRIMFAGAAASVVTDYIHDKFVDPAFDFNSVSHDALLASLAAPKVAREVYFIDSRVPDIGAVAKDLGPNADVHVLDAESDGVHQIAEVLAGRRL